MRANAGVEHRIPTPQRLLPKWFGPSERTILDHAFITAPHVVHEDVDSRSLARHELECCRNITIKAMVAANPRNKIVRRSSRLRRSSGDEHTYTVSGEFESDSSS